jgi:ATP-dependent Clp protease adaptor protein ClpS
VVGDKGDCGCYAFGMATAVETAPETRRRTLRLPPHAVILHNDDFNSMDHVVNVLGKVFGYAVEKCVTIMLEAHEKGRAVAWTGSLEVAEFKADQIHSCGADPAVRKAQPLRVTIEPLA